MTAPAPAGCTRDQEIENRYAATPSPAISRTSSAYRWYESQATSPVSPPRTAPGVWLKVSQIDGPRPSSATAPSIWYAAVAVPNWKPGGNWRPSSITAPRYPLATVLP